MGDSGAACFHTLTSESRDLAKIDWDKERFGMVCTKAQNFAEMKAAVEKLCHKSKLCTYEDRQLMRAFFERVDEVTHRIYYVGY